MLPCHKDPKSRSWTKTAFEDLESGAFVASSSRSSVSVYPRRWTPRESVRRTSESGRSFCPCGDLSQRYSLTLIPSKSAVNAWRVNPIGWTVLSTCRRPDSDAPPRSAFISDRPGYPAKLVKIAVQAVIITNKAAAFVSPRASADDSRPPASHLRTMSA